MNKISPGVGGSAGVADAVICGGFCATFSDSNLNSSHDNFSIQDSSLGHCENVLSVRKSIRMSLEMSIGIFAKFIFFFFVFVIVL